MFSVSNSVSLSQVMLTRMVSRHYLHPWLTGDPYFYSTDVKCINIHICIWKDMNKIQQNLSNSVALYKSHRLHKDCMLWTMHGGYSTNHHSVMKNILEAHILAISEKYLIETFELWRIKNKMLHAVNDCLINTMNYFQTSCFLNI